MNKDSILSQLVNSEMMKELKTNIKDENYLKEKNVPEDEWGRVLKELREQREEREARAKELEEKTGGTYDPRSQRKEKPFSAVSHDIAPQNQEVGEMPSFDDVFNPGVPADQPDKDEDEVAYEAAEFKPADAEPEKNTPDTNKDRGDAPQPPAPEGNDGEDKGEKPAAQNPKSGLPPMTIATPTGDLPVDNQETFAEETEQKKTKPAKKKKKTTPPPEPDSDSAVEDDDSEGNLMAEILGNKKILLTSAGILATLVLIIILLTSPFGGDKEDTDTPPPENAGAAAPAPAPGGDFAEQPKKDEKQIIAPASKEAKCEGGISTSIDMALDDDTNTAWICQRSLGIDGNTAHFTFDRPVVITELRIIAGNAQVTASGEDQWEAYRRVKRINVFISGQPNVYELNGDKGGDVVALTNPTATTDVTIVIQQTEGSDSNGIGGDQTADAFAVSTLEFHGHDAA